MALTVKYEFLKNYSLLVFHKNSNHIVLKTFLLILKSHRHLKQYKYFLNKNIIKVLLMKKIPVPHHEAEITIH